jgi:hypothetical protein
MPLRIVTIPGFERRSADENNLEKSLKQMRESFTTKPMISSGSLRNLERLLAPVFLGMAALCAQMFWHNYFGAYLGRVTDTDLIRTRFNMGPEHFCSQLHSRLLCR